MSALPSMGGVAGLVVATALVPGPAYALTRKEAATLPVSVLARRVLNKAGTDVVAIDRPAWRAHCGGPLCPPLDYRKVQRWGPAPLSEGMTLYRRARPVVPDAGTPGLCSTIAIHVALTAGGKLDGTYTTRRYGFATGENETAGAAAGATCASIRSMDGFFTADADASAYRAVLASQQLQDAARRRTLSFAFTCRLMPFGYAKPCAGLSGAATAAVDLRVAELVDVQAQRCARPVPGHTCYTVAVRTPGGHATIEMADTPAGPRLASLDYQIDAVIW